MYACGSGKNPNKGRWRAEYKSVSRWFYFGSKHMWRRISLLLFIRLFVCLFVTYIYIFYSHRPYILFQGCLMVSYLPYSSMLQLHSRLFCTCKWVLHRVLYVVCRQNLLVWGSYCWSSFFIFLHRGWKLLSWYESVVDGSIHRCRCCVHGERARGGDAFCLPWLYEICSGALLFFQGYISCHTTVPITWAVCFPPSKSRMLKKRTETTEGWMTIVKILQLYDIST